MNSYTIYNKDSAFTRVNRKRALTAYKNGMTVVVCPVNLRPFSPWHPEYSLNINSLQQYITEEMSVEDGFNKFLNEYEYYNCINNETGRYAAFYIPVEEERKC